MGLTLSPEKTLVTPGTDTMRFLGHHLRVRQDPLRRQLRPRLVIPKERSKRLRPTIQLIFDRSLSTETLEQRPKRLNPALRGWGNFYRHAWGAKRVFAALDHYVWWTILRWLKKRHPHARIRDLMKQYGWHQSRRRSLRWRDGGLVPTSLAAPRVGPYRLGNERGPRYAENIEGEPGA